MSVATPLSPTPPTGPLRPFSVDEYHRMIQNGVLTEDDPVELLEGWIVFKMARNPPHDATVDIVHEAIRLRIPAGWTIRLQSAITTADSEPEPDLVVAAGTPRTYIDHHPGPPEIALVAEIANTSLMRDRDEKKRIYGRAGIRAYWIINLPDRRVEVYTNPSGPGPSPGYAQRDDYTPGQSLPLMIGAVVASVPAAELLP